MERNVFFAHPGNLLVAMMSYSEDSVLDQGADRALAVRNQKLSDAALNIRQLRAPPLNWEAESYPDKTKCDKVTVTEPPVTASSKVSESSRWMYPVFRATHNRWNAA